ncbi:hypothetical protein [Streptococcus devriesei]|uniref:hypothetical protein n=1 Tax=Streptococcus devriesei TaxID=231233 RepID=UPI0003FAE81B|nr:hypothetical protein [Streptococcus devriesei]
MKQNEWQQQFRAANGREPSQEEFQAAFQRGEFTASRQQPKKKMKTSTIVIISLVSVFAVLLLIAGGAAAYYYYSGNIDGTWERVSSSSYSSKKHKWIDADEENEKAKINYHQFLEVEKGSLKTYSYYKLEYNMELPDTDSEYEELFSSARTTYTGHIRPTHKADIWKREIRMSISQKDFVSDLNRYIDDYIKTKYLSDSDLQETKKGYEKDFKNQKARKITYQKKGDRLTLKAYNKKGKLTDKTTYVKRTGKAANKLHNTYKKIEDKERQLIKKYNNY